jgi:integrase
MRVELSPQFVKKAKAQPGNERTIYWDKGLEGFGLMVTAAGHRSYVVQYRSAHISRRYTLDGRLKLGQARKQAKVIQGKVAQGGDPVAEERKTKRVAANTLQSVAEEYLGREGKKLRSIAERRRIFNRYIYPKLGARQIDDIGRLDIVRLLDVIDDKSGPVMADHTLALLRRLMSWHASRSDEYRSPIVRGMARTKVRDRARQRILADDELRAVWKATEGWDTAYAHMVRFILLTATRLREAANMKHTEVSGTEWVIPAARHKSKKDFLLPLSQAAADVLKRVPIIGRKEWVFTNDGEAPISGFSKFKRALDTRVLIELHKHDQKAKLPRWTTHDLRRTARSLMSRAGAAPNHAERALGHVIAGVRGIYDRHSYAKEKQHVFNVLAAELGRVLAPVDDVIDLHKCG